MRMYFIEDQHGRDKFIFAKTNERAAELFVAWQILNNAEMGGFSVERVTAASRIEPDSSHLRMALRLELEGIGHYEAAVGWKIEAVAEDQIE